MKFKCIATAHFHLSRCYTSSLLLTSNRLRQYEANHDLKARRHLYRIVLEKGGSKVARRRHDTSQHVQVGHCLGYCSDVNKFKCILIVYSRSNRYSTFHLLYASKNFLSSTSDDRLFSPRGFMALPSSHFVWLVPLIIWLKTLPNQLGYRQLPSVSQPLTQKYLLFPQSKKKVSQQPIWLSSFLKQHTNCPTTLSQRTCCRC